MVERSELEKRVRRLVASDISYRVLKSLGEKGVRRLGKIAEQIEEALETEEANERFSAQIKTSPEEKARTLRQGIDAFKEEHPKYGPILEKMIAEKRTQSNKQLFYRINPGYKLSEDDYVLVMMDLGFDRREASAIYPHIISISERLGKADENLERTILIG